MSITFESARLSKLKFAYTTRHLRPGLVAGLTTCGSPRTGDVVIARVIEIGQHGRLECTDSRKATLFPGDEIVVCYANRYAPAQYEAVVPATIGPCDLVAAGGVAARALSQHTSKDDPTKIDVLGFATDRDARTINVGDHRVVPSPERRQREPHQPFTIVVAGTSMDSGKTTSAAGIVKGLTDAGLSVGAAKVTGTGAGNDLWLLADAGARPVIDFTAVGMASTYLMGHDRIVDSFVSLHDHLASAGVDVVVIEIADGLFLSETAALLACDDLRSRCDGVVFAAGDAAGAQNGVSVLRSLGLDVLGVSGLLTASPLAVREARAGVDVPVLTLAELWSADHDLLDGAPCEQALRRGRDPLAPDAALPTTAGTLAS